MRPRWGQVRAFCIAQGYRETRTDHYFYDKVLSDGSSGTKVSFGKDGIDVPPSLWTRIWRLQLRLASEDEFWTGLEGGAVRYALPPVSDPVTPLPAYLYRFLSDVLHYSEEQIAAISREDAQDLLNAHYSGTLRQPPK